MKEFIRFTFVGAAVAALLSLGLLGQEPGSAARPKRPPRPGVADASLKRPLTSIEPVHIFTIEGIPDWVAVGPDALWFSHRPSNSINRLDPAKNEVIARIPVGKRPCSGMVYGFDSMWVPHCDEKALYRVSTETQEVTAVLSLGPANSEGGLTASEDSVWMLTDAEGVLSRIDPKTNRVVDEIKTPAGCYDAAFGFGAVWVTCEEPDLLLRVDPASGKILERIAVAGGPLFLAVGEGAVWTLNRKDGTVARVNPHSNAVEAVIACGVPRAGDIAAGEGAVWVSSFEFPLTRIDPATNQVTHQFSGPGGDAIRVAFGSVWVSYLREGFIWRIDPNQL